MVSRNSRLRRRSRHELIADIWESDKSRWWSWPEMFEDGGLISGWRSIPLPDQVSIALKFHRNSSWTAESVLVDRGFILLREGKGANTIFKVATEEDRHRAIERVKSLLIPLEYKKNKIDQRIANGKRAGILPRGMTRAKLEANLSRLRPLALGE